jgi:EmrB/QacA subfamily drug resistance transporter
MPRGQPSSWAILTLLCAAQFMVVLDFSIVNVALPSIQRAFDVSQAWLQGLVSAYALTFGGLLLLGGRAADLFGRRRMFSFGLLLFALASLLGGVAPNPALLVAARALQGIGAAILSPAALSLVTSIFRDGRERHRALGIYGALGAGGFAIGVFLGGLLTDGPGWRWVFFVNVPIGLVAALFSPRLLPQPAERPTARELDLPGALTATIGLGLFVLGLTEAPDWGWSSAQTWVCIVVALGCLAMFLAIEKRAKAPLVRLGLFRNRCVTVANAVALLTTAGIAPQVFVFSIYLQTVEGYSALRTGLIFLVQGATAVFGAVLVRFDSAGRRNRTCNEGANVELGLASGMLYTAQQVGAALGISTLIAIAATRTALVQQNGIDPTAAVVDGFRFALGGAALISMLAAAVALAEPGRQAQAQANIAEIPRPRDRAA